jgi:hypothetical protein
MLIGSPNVPWSESAWGAYRQHHDMASPRLDQLASPKVGVVEELKRARLQPDAARRVLAVSLAFPFSD